MIGSLRGTVLERTTDGEVLLEVGGVGYRVQVSARTLAELEPTSPAFLHVHHHIREDAQVLFGFLSRDERLTFELLLKANGVGPSLAMAILSTHTPAVLRDIIASADLASLCVVPGVGKKTAERLMVELKNRLAMPDVDMAAVIGGPKAAPNAVADVREALGQLGYSVEEIRETLRDLPPSKDASVMLRDALKLLGARRA